MVQYRVDWADPDRAVPGFATGPSGGVALSSDHADPHLYDETQLGLSFGLRWLVVPRYNDRFVIQLVGDFQARSVRRACDDPAHAPGSAL